MIKLLHSAKFWAITWGAGYGAFLYWLLGDGKGLGSGFVMLLVSSYAGIAFSDKLKDAIVAYKNKGNKDGV